MDLDNIKKVFTEINNLSKVLGLHGKARKIVFIVSGLYPAYWVGDALINLFLHDITFWVTLQMVAVGIFIFIMTLGFIELILWIVAEITDY